jgi:hypothetical protein
VDYNPEFMTDYKSDLQCFGPVAIKQGQNEVRASQHDTWGVIACEKCQQKFIFGPNRIYGTRGNRTKEDYAAIVHEILKADHHHNRPHENAYELGED